MEGAGERTSNEMLGPGCISSRTLRTRWHKHAHAK